MTIVKTYTKGQLVIPQKIRKAIGLKRGQKVKLQLINDQRVELTPVPDNPIDVFFGIFKEGTSLTKALMKEHREEKVRERKKADRLLCPSRLSKKRTQRSKGKGSPQ
jgi:AbrB family looped-hinge helix DNA binding protein